MRKRGRDDSEAVIEGCLDKVEEMMATVRTCWMFLATELMRVRRVWRFAVCWCMFIGRCGGGERGPEGKEGAGREEGVVERRVRGVLGFIVRGVRRQGRGRGIDGRDLGRE